MPWTGGQGKLRTRAGLAVAGSQGGIAEKEVSREGKEVPLAGARVAPIWNTMAMIQAASWTPSHAVFQAFFSTAQKVRLIGNGWR